MALHSWVQAKHHLEKYVAASGVAFALGGSESLYCLYVLSARAVSKGHASMTLRCLYYTCSSHSNRARHELYISLGLS